MDYVFAGREPIKFKDENVDFEGTVGVAQLRGAKPALFLGAGGRISLPLGGGGGEQRRRLLREGVEVSRAGRVDLARFRWSGD